MACVVGVLITAVLFRSNLLVAQLTCTYGTVYADMVGTTGNELVNNLATIARLGTKACRTAAAFEVELWSKALDAFPAQILGLVASLPFSDDGCTEQNQRIHSGTSRGDRPASH